MKNKKLLSVLLTLVLLFAMMPVLETQAHAYTQGVYFGISILDAQSEDDTLSDAKIDSGELPPGMSLKIRTEFPAGVIPFVEAVGTPTTPGTYTGVVSAFAAKTNARIHTSFSITIDEDKSATAAPPAGAATPAAPTAASSLAAKITKHPGGEDVKVGESAVFTAGADNYKSITWRIVSADTKTTVQAGEAEGYFTGLKVSTYKTPSGREAIELNNIPLSLNGWKVEAKFIGNDGNAVFTNGAKIGVTVAPATPAPTPTPTPTPKPTPTPAPTATPQVSIESAQTPATPTPTVAPIAPVEAAPVPVENEKSDSGVPWWAVCLIVLGVILVGIVAYSLLIKPSQSTGHSPKHENQPRQKTYTGIRCDKCGWECTDPDNIPHFCPECGDPIGGEDIRR